MSTEVPTVDWTHAYRSFESDALVSLPRTREQFEGWAKRIFELGEIEDTPDHRQVLAMSIQRLPPDKVEYFMSDFVVALQKSDANFVAYQVILECKQAEKEFEAEQEAKLKALSEQDVPKAQEDETDAHVAPV